MTCCNNNNHTEPPVRHLRFLGGCGQATEEELMEKQGKEEGNGETCDAEMNNIQNMRAWMKANNKDYYSIYYVDGTDYEVVE